jgi:hypothetical protein
MWCAPEGLAGPQERDAKGRTRNNLNKQRDCAFTHKQTRFRQSMLPMQYTKVPNTRDDLAGC